MRIHRSAEIDDPKVQYSLRPIYEETKRPAKKEQL
jgi:hypothetical protein